MGTTVENDPRYAMVAGRHDASSFEHRQKLAFSLTNSQAMAGSNVKMEDVAALIGAVSIDPLSQTAGLQRQNLAV